MNYPNHIMKMQNRWRVLLSAITVLALTSVFPTAQAFQIDTGNPAWNMALNTTVRYNLGLRVEPQQSMIMNTPTFNESDAKFDQWDIISNRITIAPEFYASYKRKYGLYLSGTAFVDFAYMDQDVPTPGGRPSSYKNNEYSPYTTRHYRGPYIELLGAFLFGNFKVGSVPIHVKAGRITQQWGPGLLLAGQSIAVNQQPLNIRKSLSVPGSKISELFFPTAQVQAQFVWNRRLATTVQYYLEYRHNRYPTGGTYFGGPDWAWQGPDRAYFPVGGGTYLNHTTTDAPRNMSDPEWGIMTKWKPTWFNGTVGFYYRRFNSKYGWFHLDFAKKQYRLVFPTNTRLYGVSVDRNIGPLAVGFQLSYLDNAALAGSANANGEGPRGQVLNITANTLWTTSMFPFADKSMLLAEIGYQHLIDVTDHEGLFNGGSNCTDRWKGCATHNSWKVATTFTPTWIQVIPQWNLSMPISLYYSLYGNGATLPTAGVRQAAITYSVGLQAIYRSRYSIGLTYADSYAQYNVGTSGRVTGNGSWFYNDRGRVTLTLQTTF